MMGYEEWRRAPAAAIAPIAPHSAGSLRSRSNNIGAIRLMLALSVVFAHSAPLGTMTDRTGTWAVNMFFVISGWLIAQSWLRSGSAAAYMAKRVRRIYPAFIAAWIVTWAIAVGLLGERPSNIYGVLLLQPPVAANGHWINEPMWTIAYEMRAYLVVLLLGALGVLRDRRAVLAIAIASIAIFICADQLMIRGIAPAVAVPVTLNTTVGAPWEWARLWPCFALGMVALLYREVVDRLVNHRTIALWVALFVMSQMIWSAQGIGSVFFGAGIIYYLAFKLPPAGINDRADISYGLYLFGMPAQMILQLALPRPSWELGLAAIIAAALCGWISWHLVEKRFLGLR